MSKTPNYYIVEADALPEIFRKVVEARRMLDTGEAETVNQAVQLTGISRSAFYKYRDAVRPFQDMLHGRIVTFQIMMKDEPGILSQVLNFFCRLWGQYPHHQPGPAHQRLRRGDGERRDFRPARVFAGTAGPAQRGRGGSPRGDPGRLTAQAIEYRTKDGNKPW